MKNLKKIPIDENLAVSPSINCNDRLATEEVTNPINEELSQNLSATGACHIPKTPGGMRS
jgi:hypothetical protein